MYILLTRDGFLKPFFIKPDVVCLPLSKFGTLACVCFTFNTEFSARGPLGGAHFDPI